MYSYEELVGIIAELRSDHGCPWDKAQTHESMISCLRNECEEVVEAIEQKDPENLCEELGDVLLQVLLHAQIAKEEGLFTMDDVINGLAEKMIIHMYLATKNMVPTSRIRLAGRKSSGRKRRQSGIEKPRNFKGNRLTNSRKTGITMIRVVHNK